MSLNLNSYYFGGKATYYPFIFNSKNSRSKRTYLDMLGDSNLSLINDRIKNYKLNNKTNNIIEDYYSKNKINYENLDKSNSNVLINTSNINSLKKNIVIKNKMVYNEEKERKWVETYYKIKNGELNKLRFGTG